MGYDSHYALLQNPYILSLELSALLAFKSTQEIWNENVNLFNKSAEIIGCTANMELRTRTLIPTAPLLIEESNESATKTQQRENQVANTMVACYYLFGEDFSKITMNEHTKLNSAEEIRSPAEREDFKNELQSLHSQITAA